MISRLRGVPVGRSPDGLVLDVGGVGYLVAATPSALGRADSGREVSLETYLHVREDALQLYGFGDASERELFVSLLGVSGIGPKVALAVVSSSPAAELRRAIALGDAARFQAIPGIGKKTAERLLLELKGKFGPDLAASSPVASDAQADILQALVALGYSEKEAASALKALPAEVGVSEGIRLALKALAR